MAVRKLITIISSAGDDTVEVRTDSNLFCYFPIKSSDKVLTFIDATLGKLPTATVVFSLSDKNFAILRFTKNYGDVGAVGCHVVETRANQCANSYLQGSAAC